MIEVSVIWDRELDCYWGEGVWGLIKDAKRYANHIHAKNDIDAMDKSAFHNFLSIEKVFVRA